MTNPVQDINIISFNYTQTIEKILGVKSLNNKIDTHENKLTILHSLEHIHGYINDRMVMGVNDTLQIKNKSFRENQDVIEAFVKTKCNQVQKHAVDNLCKQQINKANLICIFGSSIGKTDNLWWQLIGEQVKRGSKLIIFDICKEIPPRKAYLKSRIERKKRDTFLELLKLNETEKEKVEKNIFFGLNTGMFDILKNENSER